MAWAISYLPPPPPLYKPECPANFKLRRDQWESWLPSSHHHPSINFFPLFFLSLSKMFWRGVLWSCVCRSVTSPTLLVWPTPKTFRRFFTWKKNTFGHTHHTLYSADGTDSVCDARARATDSLCQEILSPVPKEVEKIIKNGPPPLPSANYGIFIFFPPFRSGQEKRNTVHD